MEFDKGDFNRRFVDGYQSIQRDICNAQLHGEHFPSVRFRFGSPYELDSDCRYPDIRCVRINESGRSCGPQNVAHIFNVRCLRRPRITWHILIPHQRAPHGFARAELGAIGQFLHIHVHQLLWHRPIAIHRAHRNTSVEGKH